MSEQVDLWVCADCAGAADEATDGTWRPVDAYRVGGSWCGVCEADTFVRTGLVVVAS